MKTQWKLKILNTKYQGAEILLSEKQQLGRDEQIADLVVDEPGILGEHMTILSTNDGIKISGLGDNLVILVNGENWDINKALPKFTAITIGQLSVMVAEATDDWPSDNDCSLSDVPAQKPTKTKASKLSENNLETTQKKVQISQSKAYMLYKHASKLMIGSACIAIAFTLSVYSETTPTTSLTNNIISPEKINAAFQDNLHPHLIVKWSSDRQELSLSGYVETLADKKALQAKAESLNVRFTNQTRTMEEIKSGASFILKNLRLNPTKIKSGEKPGSLIFVTNANQLALWKKVEDILQKDIPGLTSWQLEILEEKPALQQLKNMLEQASLAEKLSIQDKGERIELTGNLVGPEIRKFKRLKTAFKKKFGNYPYLILQTPASNTESTFNLSIKAVRFGKAPHITLDNNKKYFEGGQLPNGYQVASIDSENLAFKNAGKTVIISLKQY